MDKATEKRFITFTAAAVIISLTLSGAVSVLTPAPIPLEDVDLNGGILPPANATYGVEIGYLDDTRQGEEYVWTALISDDHDIGVVWVNNTGTEDDIYTISVNEVPEGWSVSVDKTAVAVVPFDDMGVVILTYNVPDGTTGIHNVSVSAQSQTDPDVRMEITILCLVESTNKDIAGVGNTILVSYSLIDEAGTMQTESGNLPVTAGELYVGSGNQLAYVEGFYMGALGLRIPDLATSGETKVIRVPPELGYGETPVDEGGHSIGGMVLLFTLTVLSDIPG